MQESIYDSNRVISNWSALPSRVVLSETLTLIKIVSLSPINWIRKMQEPGVNMCDQEVLIYDVKPILRNDEEKELVWCRREEQRKLIDRTFLKPLLKMPYIFCEFGCYNRKLFVNTPISFFSYNTGPNVNKKMTHQQLKLIKEYSSLFGRKIS